MSDNTLLLRALRLNAIFSASSALMMLPAGPWLATQLGLTSVMPIYVTATLLGVFALQLGNIVRTRKIHDLEIVGIIFADITWVVGSVVLGALFYSSLTVAGLVLVDVVSIAVLYLAIQQVRGLKAVRKSAMA